MIIVTHAVMTQATSQQIESGHEGMIPGPDVHDMEMADVDTPRSVLESSRGPDIPPRHHHAQAAATAVTAVTDAGQKFLDTFWKKPGRAECQQPPYPACSSQPPPPPPHQEFHEPTDGHPLPETPTVEQDQQFSFNLLEAELRSRIEQLEAELAAAPNPDFVQALQRTLETETAERQRDRNKAHQDIQQKNNELDSLRKRWKQAARELDKSRSQNQGFYQVTDNYLIELTTRLRYNIRNFAIQYFGGELKASKPKLDKPKAWDPYMATTTQGSECEALLFSERRPSVIQAFIWRFIVGQVFDNFRWAGEKGVTLRNLCLSLRPEGQYPDSDSAIVPEEERRFQMWLANTTAMVLDKETKMETKVKSLVDKVREVIDSFITLKDSAYAEEVNLLVEDAVKLDLEICRQVARIEWVFPTPGKEVVFDSQTMRLGTAEILAKEKQVVHLVVCPAMKKRGKSTGEDFHSESLLVPMEVSCEPIAKGKK
ncbi:hypothetical protein BJX99DRAFT_232293 [Aspergillus californicus]